MPSNRDPEPIDYQELAFDQIKTLNTQQRRGGSANFQQLLKDEGVDWV